MNGYSLLELTVVLALVAVLAGVTYPAVQGYRDRASVLSARETLVSLIQEARARAVRHGAASVRVDALSLRAWVVDDGGVARSEDLRAIGRLQLSLSGGRTSSEIAFNALGLGVFANESIALQSGSARAGLVISSYGRVRRE